MPTSLNKYRTRDRRHYYKHLTCFLGQYNTRTPISISLIYIPGPLFPSIPYGRANIHPETLKKSLCPPQYWLPIALLSCLGKALEILTAKRIIHVVISQKVLVRQQLGVLPKHPSIDLVGCLTHDIEKACSQ